MSGGWQLVIHEEVWEACERLRPAERQRLKSGLRALLADPYQRPDAEQRREASRTYPVKYVGPFRITYWLDSFVKELRIVDLERIKLG